MTLHKPKIVPFAHPFMIQASAVPDDPHCHFLNLIQQVVDSIIPTDFWIESKTTADYEKFFGKLFSLLPIFKHSGIHDLSDSFSITYLCPAKYNPHARNYVTEMLKNWFVSGKEIEIAGGMGINFQFVQDPSHTFFIAQEFITIRDRKENQAIQQNLPSFLLELKQLFFKKTQNTDSPPFLTETLKKEPFSPSVVSKSNIVHPIFMPRNEEELIRNLIILSNQIKYVRDLPQISIHFEKQTETNLTFTIIIARLLKGNVKSLRKLLESSSCKMDIDDTRIMGYLKQKYPKEAAILRMNVKKGSFFRADHSVDLLRARQKIVANLTQCLGEFRDFNGGMILKQEEALAQLRQLLDNLSPEKEFLLENYFYSLKPGVMQTVHDTLILKKHFEMLTAVLENGQKISSEIQGKFHLCFITSDRMNFKEEVFQAIAPLQIPPRNLTYSYLEMETISTLGFILRIESLENAHQFQKQLLSVQ